MGFRPSIFTFATIGSMLLASCSPQIVGERLSETEGRSATTCSLQGLSYPQAQAIKNRDPVDISPSLTAGIPIRFEISPALPAGLMFDPQTGRISGLPTVASSSQTYTVSARAEGGCSIATAVSLRITGTDPDLSSLTVTPGQIQVGNAVSVQVSLRDARGNPVAGNQVSLTSSRPEDAITAFAGGISDAEGHASFIVFSTLAGHAVLSATDVTDLETLFAMTPVEFTPGPAVRLAFSGLPHGTVAGANLNYTIRAVDHYNNLNPGFEGAVTVSHDDTKPQSEGGAAIHLTLEGGEANATAKLTKIQNTTFTVVHSPLNGPPFLDLATKTVTVTPGALDPNQTEITTPLTSYTSNENISLVIIPKDAFENPFPYDVPDPREVELVVSGEGSITGNTAPPVYSDAAGTWTFSALTAKRAGTVTLSPKIRGSTSPNSVTLTIQPGPLMRRTLVGLPPSVVAGELISELVLVGSDEFENQVNPGTPAIDTYVDANCLIPTPGPVDLSSYQPSATYDPESKVSTYADLRLFKTWIGSVGIASAPRVCQKIEVIPQAASATQSYLAFDTFPFTVPLVARTLNRSSLAGVRLQVLDDFQNPIGGVPVQIGKSVSLQTQPELFPAFHIPDFRFGWVSTNNAEEITLDSDPKGVARFAIGHTLLVPDINYDSDVVLTGNVNGTIGNQLDLEFRDTAPDESSLPGNLQAPGARFAIEAPTPMPTAFMGLPKSIVAIVTTDENTSEVRILCPGVLLDLDRVLTLASCLLRETAHLGTLLQIRAGTFENTPSPSMHEQTRDVEIAVFHPDYSLTHPLTDLAILKTATPFTGNNMIEPASLPNSSSTLSSPASVVSAIPGFRAYSWSHIPFTSRTNDTESTHLLRIPGGSIIQSYSGAPFNIPFATLRFAPGPTNPTRVISLGTEAILMGDAKSFLGFTVAGGEMNEPSTADFNPDSAQPLQMIIRLNTADTAILIPNDLPFLQTLAPPVDP